MSINQPKLVQYVGNKPEKKDTVAGTNLYWPGNKSVLEVEHTVATQLLRYPDVWIEVDAKGNPVTGGRPVEMPSEPESGGEPEQGESEAEGEGPESNDLPGRIREAIDSLDPDNDDHFSSAGKPKVGAVSDVLGEKVTAQQVQEAWAAE